jgi:hypothetical protein
MQHRVARITVRPGLRGQSVKNKAWFWLPSAVKESFGWSFILRTKIYELSNAMRNLVLSQLDADLNLNMIVLTALTLQA